MIFPPTLLSGTLIKRYKRFLADVTLENGEEITVHCPNSGSMTGCSTPGSQIYLSTSDNPKRKYPNTLEIIKEGDTWIGVNTSLTNKLVVEGIKDGKVPELQPFDQIKQEIKTSEKSRLDILLTHNTTKTYVEVKNCSLVENGIAMFPDAVTTRGTKHLLELEDLVAQGHYGYIFFLVQRVDADTFTPAAHVDPTYAKTLKRVAGNGVKILVYQASVSPEKIEIIRKLPYTL